tara:strand:+ start:43 stop:795 length:753 start_codon:yes stop_codon:yes gene_type:complete
MGKYFTSTAIPTIPASAQHATIVSGRVLFDWTELEIPKGSSALRGLTILMRPKGDATPTSNRVSMELVFSKTNTVSLGTAGVAPNKLPSNDFLGRIEIETSNYSQATMLSTSVATSGKGSNNGTDLTPIVLTGGPTSGTNVGYDKIYVAAIATNTFNGTSINTVASTAAAGTTVVCDGTSFLNANHFLPGDVLQSATTVGANDADTVMGTIASITNATTLELTTTSLDTFVDGTILINQNPIRVICSFEK